MTLLFYKVFHIWTTAAWTGPRRGKWPKNYNNYLIYFWAFFVIFVVFWQKPRRKAVHRGSNRSTAAQAVHRGGPVHAAFFGFSINNYLLMHYTKLNLKLIDDPFWPRSKLKLIHFFDDKKISFTIDTRKLFTRGETLYYFSVIKSFNSFRCNL